MREIGQLQQQTVTKEQECVESVIFPERIDQSILDFARK
jgi:hypothetical protein